jgi:hypothetical protein
MADLRFGSDHAPPQRTHRGLVVVGDVLTLELDAPIGGLQHRQDRESGGRLSAAALADKTKRLATLHAEGDLS